MFSSEHLVIASSTDPSFLLYLCPSLHPSSFSIPQYVPPDLCICNFVLEQSLSVRALQEMLANTGQNSEGVSASLSSTDTTEHHI